MTLLKYFKPTKAPRVSTFPHPSGLLSEIMPSSFIEAANKEVKSVIDVAYYDVRFTNTTVNKL